LAYRTHSKGPDREKSYALEQVAAFLQGAAVQRKEGQQEKQKNSILDDKKPEQKGSQEGLTKRKVPKGSLNDSGVLVEKE
jgi:hypothetical protein